MAPGADAGIVVPAGDMAVRMRLVFIPFLVSNTAALTVVDATGGSLSGIFARWLLSLRAIFIVSMPLLWLSSSERVSLAVFYVNHAAVIASVIHSFVMDAGSPGGCESASLGTLLILPFTAYMVRWLVGLANSRVALVEVAVLCCACWAVFFTHCSASAVTLVAPMSASCQSAAMLISCVALVCAEAFMWRVRPWKAALLPPELSKAADPAPRGAAEVVGAGTLEAGAAPALSCSGARGGGGSGAPGGTRTPPGARPGLLVRLGCGAEVLELPARAVGQLTVAQLKTKIFEAIGMPEQHQCLHAQGQQMVPDEAHVCDWQVSGGGLSDLVLVVRLQERDDDSLCEQVVRTAKRKPTF